VKAKVPAPTAEEWRGAATTATEPAPAPKPVAEGRGGRSAASMRAPTAEGPRTRAPDADGRRVEGQGGKSDGARAHTDGRETEGRCCSGDGTEVEGQGGKSDGASAATACTRKDRGAGRQKCGDNARARDRD
jgi:hypothetical protein